MPETWPGCRSAHLSFRIHARFGPPREESHLQCKLHLFRKFNKEEDSFLLTLQWYCFEHDLRRTSRIFLKSF